jgi:AcrR family transcriptional regulator
MAGVPRPRVHDLDAVMDAAELLAIKSGPNAVTIRAISATTGMSNGAIYHGFGSRAGLLGRVRLRAAERFLLLQREAVERALAVSPSREAAAEAVVAAADAPAIFLEQYPTCGRFLLTVRRDELIGSSEIPPDVATQLRKLDNLLGDLFAQLARRLWDRDDRDAIGIMRDCIVELPSALLLRGHRTTDHLARQRLSAAVRAVLQVGPPSAQQQPIQKRRSSS